MSNLMTYPALRHLMQAYLHQDYDLVGTVDENLDAFVSEDPGLAERLPGEVDELLATTTEDGDLRNAVREMGCQLRPEQGTYRDWLQQIANRVRDATS